MLQLLACTLMSSVHVSGGTVWPRPRQESRGTASVSVSPDTFQITCPASPKFLLDACNRYQKLFFPFTKPARLNAVNVNGEDMQMQMKMNMNTTATYMFKVDVSDTSATPKLQLGMDESYILNITDTSASLSSKTAWGALRGLETMSQLIDSVGMAAYQITRAPINIADEPRFQWRGLLVDSSRHFLPLSTLRMIIDTLAYNKFNTLHWHLVDAQSFPVQINAYPLLSSKGAYGKDAVYSQADIASIVDYAYTRGVRVMPEFDVPGHAHSWGEGYPAIRAVCPDRLSANINNYPINPANEQTFTIMDAIFAEMSKIFTDQFLHTGGDEVAYGCWTEDPAIAAWMKTQGLKDGPAVFGYVEKKVAAIARKHFPGALVWQEPVEDDVPLPKDTLVHVWKSNVVVKSIISKGYKVIVSGGWYLDQQIPNASSTHYGWEDTWLDFYNLDPVHALSPQEATQVLGGEAAMWGEQVDETNIHSRMWPRASAVGERLWSWNIVSATEAKPRLSEFRCKSLARRGITAGPIMPEYCRLPTF